MVIIVPSLLVSSSDVSGSGSDSSLLFVWQTTIFIQLTEQDKKEMIDLNIIIIIIIDLIDPLALQRLSSGTCLDSH